MTKILLGHDPSNVSEKDLARIRTLAPDMDLVVTEDRAEIEQVLDDIEIAARRFPHDLIPSAPKLCWVQQWGAGADWLMRYPDIAKLDFVLTNASGVHPIQITEHILAFLLAFARQLHYALRAQAKREWRRPSKEGFSGSESFFELKNKTMLLIGVGAIGERTAEVAEAMGMRVVGIRSDPAQELAHVSAMHGPEQLLDLLPDADFVVLTIPLTPDTEGMIGEQELRAMKSSAYIVNIGRGGTIQEDTLIQALKEGWIAGAGLDVFEIEPLPSDSPLWDLDNVIITAHYAGLTPHYEERAMQIFLENLDRYQTGRPLYNVVDKTAGY
jgi:phosphoglycerate dehydrogenase-like enzyme